MPGLSQLKKFSSDLLSLGDEITIRAGRGEKPVAVEIPKTVEDKNDSEDFVLGMPEIEAEVEALPVDEDLSDLTGLVSPSSSSESAEEAAPAFAAPDLSSILNPIAAGDDSNGGEMPDLSMFMEEEATPEEVIEEEPEEVSIADMGLEALLAGGSDFGEEESETETDEGAQAAAEESDDFGSAEAAGVEDFGTESEAFDDFSADSPETAEAVAEPLEDVEALENIDELSEEQGTESNKEPGLDELLGNLDIDLPADTESETSSEIEDFAEPASFDDFAEPAATDAAVIDVAEPEDVPADVENFEDADTPEVFDVSSDMSANEDFAEPAADIDFTEPLEDIGAEDIGASEDFAAPEAVDDFEVAEPAETLDDEASPVDESASVDDGAAPAGLFDAGDFDLGALDEEGSAPAPEFSVDDEIPDYGEESAEAEEASGFDTDSDGSFDEEQSDQPLEVFDAPEMEGIDFGIQDTDSQLEGNTEGDSFELGSHEDFAMEGEFEIPGFSDVVTAKEEKGAKLQLATGKEKGRKKIKNLPEPDFSDAAESEELPPNTLSDEQYKRFLKNLGEYPLNVRLAFEDFIVQNEFTDDAEFEVIEKILNKAPARSVASMLEKMLDTSIPVPRDFEHRTAEEYEAYKKSLSYQLKNKIIPGLLVGVVMLFVVWGLFNFSKNCIYKPLRANKYYKQGYALLQADEYPQSEMKFEKAVSYRINKKWFFKYARGYRSHKQYQRAAKMYQNILYCYRHDKAAGLEYADMELNDLANYEKAEEIVRREVLDYHINDPDGILMLGDVFLEWGTEKDPEKLEAAREQYATLLQLYPKSKKHDLHLSRMMRYFIRTDNLRQVITMQKHFEPKEKSLASEDWTELSGYLLDKYYGTLAPSDEYLRYEIEGLRGLLLRAVKTGPDNPIALYNLAKYFIRTGETNAIEQTLQNAIEKFNTVPSMKNRDIYKYIDSYRLLGEYYITTTDYLQAQEQFAEGISLFSTERDNAGFAGTPQVGKLYEDMGNIKYTIAGDYDDALFNYKYSVELENDSPSIRYRIGYIQYCHNNYAEALGSFMKAGDGNIKERNLLLAMGNTLSLRGDDYAAQGYYDQLINTLDEQIADRGLVFPQANIKDYDIVTQYLYASNNYGVTLYKLAKRTGNSALNAKAIVQFSQSVRAWDALTRNQETMTRLEGSNLAEMNIQYITHPIPEFEPSVYTNISKTLLNNEKL